MNGFRRVSFVAVLLVVACLAAPGLASAEQDTLDAQVNDATDCTFPYTATDATGTEVTVESAPDSVVALQPSDAQTMWDIGARDQVVAMPQNQYTAYLNDTDDRPNVKNEDLSVNVEVVTNTDADLVLAANATDPETVESLRNAGLTVYHFDGATSIDDVYEQVSMIGQLTDNCDSANETVSSMQSTVADVEQQAEGFERPDALYYFFDFTTGSDTHIHEMIESAGGNNVAAQAGLSGYLQVSEELIASQNPDWIVYPSDAEVPVDEEPFASTAAVQHDQTLSVNTHYVSQPAPRIVIPMQTMADAFADTTTSGGITDGVGTGFTAVAALIGAAFALGARYRT